jgi:hypothetical protein
MSGDDIVNRLDDALKRIGVTKIDTRSLLMILDIINNN